MTTTAAATDLQSVRALCARRALLVGHNSDGSLQLLDADTFRVAFRGTVAECRTWLLQH